MCHNIYRKGVTLWNYLRNNYHKLTYKLANKLSYKNQTVKQIAIIESLNPALFTNVSVNKASMVILPLIFNDIIVYTNKLKFCYKHCNEQVTISNIWCSYEFNDGTLESFLMNNGYLINVHKSILEFKSLLVKVSKEIDRLEKSEDFTDQHNLRMIRRFYNHCVDIVETLITFSTGVLS